MNKAEITPKTKISDFLKDYPQLEELLISLSPSFEKLRNPVLRRTIGKVATFQQIAIVGNVPLDKIINTLRNAAGQENTQIKMESNNYTTNKPEWFHESKISSVLDAREMLKQGAHPVGEVLTKTQKMASDEIFELITPFLPAPLIEKVNNQGLLAYVVSVSDDEFHSFFYKK